MTGLSRSDLGRWLGIGATALALAGCAGTLGGLTKDSPSDAKVAAVKLRAATKWAAIVQGDFDAAYALMSSASRILVSKEKFRSQLTRPFRGATVEKVTCEPELCKVELTVTYDHALMKNIATPYEEFWVLEQGAFWFVARQ